MNIFIYITHVFVPQMFNTSYFTPIHLLFFPVFCIFVKFPRNSGRDRKTNSEVLGISRYRASVLPCPAYPAGSVQPYGQHAAEDREGDDLGHGQDEFVDVVVLHCRAWISSLSDIASATLIPPRRPGPLQGMKRFRMCSCYGDTSRAVSK